MLASEAKSTWISGCGMVLGLIGALASSPGRAQQLETPVYKPGDTWTYREITEKNANGWNQTLSEIVVNRATSSTIYYSTKQSGSTQAPKEAIAGTDWSRLRDVNGKETVINRPLAFPLSVGKTWDVEYKELKPNKDHKSEQWSSRCSAGGYETVDVPAGKFNALKIECEGKWLAELEPARTVVQGARASEDNTTMITNVQRTAAITASGRLYKAFWYAPEVKRWVKSVEEYYASNGTRNERYSGELESYKFSN